MIARKIGEVEAVRKALDASIRRQLDPTHLPGGDESQQVAVQLGVTHIAILAEDPRCDLANIRSINSPTQNPEEPKRYVAHRIWAIHRDYRM